MKNLTWKEVEVVFGAKTFRTLTGNFTLTVEQNKKGRWDFQVHQDQPTKGRTSTVHVLVADGAGRSSKESKNLSVQALKKYEEAKNDVRTAKS